MPAINHKRDVDIDDVALAQWLVIRDAVTDDMIDRGANGFLETAIMERCGIGAVIHREFEGDFIEIFGGYARLHEIDQKIMRSVLEKFGGGPVGINTIAASVGEEPETIEEVYEPYLMQLGFLDRTPRGRVGTERGFEYFGIARRSRSAQMPLIEPR